MRQTINKLLILLSLTWVITGFGQAKEKQEPSDFLPKGYVLLEKINGDINKDGIADCILLIKATDKANIVINRFDEKVDRNRRGIIILLNKIDHYELALKNYECFTSENEDGGVYFPPELSIENGNMYVHFAHGRYGYWQYTFRYKNSDFELIGYDEGYKSDFSSDWVTFDEESINFLTKKKLTKEVIEVNDKGEEIYKETWKKITVSKRIKLSEIKDFYELDMSVY